MASAPVDEMPLLCELGWHRADPLARWNAGYYFTTCGRCGRDLVRTAYGGWRVPKGFKIVWQAKPPEGATAAELVPDPDAQPASGDQMELPIQEVLRHMEAEEQALEAFADAAEEEAEPVRHENPADHEPLQEVAEQDSDTELAGGGEPREEGRSEAAHEARSALEPVGEPDPGPEPGFEPDADARTDAELMAAAAAASAAAKAPAVDDFMEDDWFMNDEPGYDNWDRAAEHQIDMIEPAIVDDEKEHVGNRSGKIRYGKEVASVVSAPATFLSMLRGREEEPTDARREEAAPAPAANAAAPEHSTHGLAAATLVATFGVLLTLIATVGSGGELRRTEAAAPSSSQTQAAAPAAREQSGQAAAALTRSEETGFVTASLLNCRTAPAEQAAPVRILPRGEPVRVLALEPAWASVSHRGRQCWASTRYLSAEQPL
jgi:hypothetical protein